MPKRTYIKEGTLFLKLVKTSKIESPKKGSFRDSKIFSKKNQKAPYWFLFNDLLVYCETKKQSDDNGKLFEFKATIPVTSIRYRSEDSYSLFQSMSGNRKGED